MLRLINKRSLSDCNFLSKNVINQVLICKKDNSTGLAATYVPKELEKLKQDDNYFVSKDKGSKDPFTMILPPPNITGDLHLGHALTVAIQDAIIRWNRMRGIDSLWLPGMDHAGIATQVVVEKKLWNERQLTRHDLGRELFEKEIWKWKSEKATKIRSQLNGLGASLDWSKESFTMDRMQSLAVTEAFVRLYERNLIYRSNYLVNWSCVLRSAISDIEVDHLRITEPTLIAVPGYEKPVEFGQLNEFAYKLCESDEEIIVSTTRPETLFGDVAVAVNPKDDRYASYIGRNLWHPFRQQAIPIICDDSVDPEFGTGAVKVTPAHNQNDFEMSKRHNLNMIQVIDEGGTLTEICGRKYHGLRRFDARDAIIEELARMDLLRGRRHHEMTVPICSRSKDVIEFLVKPQWFVKCEEMASRALEDVRRGDLIVDPPQFEKTWNNWLENIRDWCISRQLWWGHRVPAFACTVRGETETGIWVAAESQEAAARKAAAQFSTGVDNVIVKQDEDVLDTWFSSALLPFTTFGWPQQTADLSKCYPLSLMETGHDILFFWVARMVMLGTQLTGKLPFKKILLHGIVCDERGRKMSKSLGNVIAPENVINGASLQDLEGASRVSHAAGILSDEELMKAIEGQQKMFPEGIPECGADALRFTLCSHNIKSHFINFDVQECKINKFFGNKIWQSVKFTNKWTEMVRNSREEVKQIEISELKRMDKWILSKLTSTVDIVNDSLHKYEFHVATSALKNFLYYDFCDVYLETTKRGLHSGDGKTASEHCFTLTFCLDNGLRCLAPFMPKLAQHLHENLYLHPSVCGEMHFPQSLPYRNVRLEENVQTILDVVTAIRRLKNVFNVSSKHKPKVCLVSDSGLYNDFAETIEDLSSCDRVTFMTEIDSDLAKEAILDTIGSHVKVYLFVPDEVRRSFESDVNKLEKKRDKLMKELSKIQTIVSADAYKLKATDTTKETHLKKIALIEDKLARIDYMKSFCRN